ncbi:lysylphosphatidylglycerol synthase transmembrane domain-containing protein [Nibrella saemangeumensis]|uniref:Lysylphosphatidylglycerol synthase transmembrane domain-containing protein n=1 Tax=Nibrella saemangeumensis TaxID=1084526 RepID=A0ABP8NEE8_9BACT
MPKLSGYVKALLKLGVTALAFWLVFRKLDVQQLGAVLSRVQMGWLVVATGLFIASKVLSAMRLRVLFEAGGLPLSTGFNLRLYWLGMFYNLFLPGGIGGDGYKVYYLNRETGVGVKPLLTATLLDRLIGLVPVLSLTLLLGGLVFSGYMPGLAVPAIKFRGISIAGLVGIVGFVTVQSLAHWVMRRFFQRFSPKLNLLITQSLGVQVLQCLCVWALWGAIESDGPVLAYQLVFLISSVVAALPLTLGGAGARELTFLAGAQYFGLPVDGAVAISFLFYGITALVSLAGGYYSWKSPLHHHTYHENTSHRRGWLHRLPSD